MVKVPFVIAAVASVGALVMIIGGALALTLNIAVLSDLAALIQMWLPFDLIVVLLWIISAAVAYLVYKLSLMALDFVNGWFNG